MKKLILKMTMVLAASALMTSCGGDDDKDTDPTPDTNTTATIYNETTKNGVAVVEVTDLGEGSGTVTWTNNKIYELQSKVFVNSGQTLTIEKGTIIKAVNKSNPSEAVALIVAAGAKIMAQGTADSPIIFTSANDALTYTTTSSLTSSDVGLWGGVVLIGNAEVDIKDEIAGGLIEGISSDETRGIYGVNTESTADNDDNSGILTYVSIRHGGASVSADSELNGLSLYGVGSGTTIDYVEVFANDDDGIEFFGGNVKLTHALVTACSDDSFDWDQGYTGMGQFWCTIQVASSDKGFECDGGEGDLDPNSIPTIANFTMIGNGTTPCVHFKKATGGHLYNGVVSGFANGFYLESITDADVSFNGVAVSGTLYQDALTPSTSSDVVANSTITVSGTDVTPEASEVTTSVATPAGLTTANYKGAFDPAGSSWAQWTQSYNLGLID